MIAVALSVGEGLGLVLLKLDVAKGRSVSKVGQLRTSSAGLAGHVEAVLLDILPESLLLGLGSL